MKFEKIMEQNKMKTWADTHKVIPASELKAEADKNSKSAKEL